MCRNVQSALHKPNGNFRSCQSLFPNRTRSFTQPSIHWNKWQLKVDLQVMSIGVQSISTQNLFYLISFHTRIVANIVFHYMDSLRLQYYSYQRSWSKQTLARGSWPSLALPQLRFPSRYCPSRETRVMRTSWLYVVWRIVMCWLSAVQGLWWIIWLFILN